MLSRSTERLKINKAKAFTTEHTEDTEKFKNQKIFSVLSVSWFIAVKFFIAPCPTLVFEGLNRALTLLHTG
jgi:hypothetical protein